MGELVQYTLNDLRRDSVPFFNRSIAELEQILKYTKHTVSRNKLQKKILFWQGEIDEVEGKPNRFRHKYPDWYRYELF